MAVVDDAGSNRDRYRIVGELGGGAMGIVYRAVDRERDEEVALKMLRRIDAAAILRFKQEFRALADVVHPNLVPLYELFSAGDAWYFTMELVEGVDFLSYVRGGPPRPSSAHGTATPLTTQPSGSQSSSDTGEGLTAPMGMPPAEPDHVPPLDAPEQLERLRQALVQLVHGIDALHRAQHLHRDIKPSNVLVTTSGRVVLLDFGIVTTLAPGGGADLTAQLVGTPAYMAPEQAAGEPLSQASDWYAVGVMLYEALCGRRPFHGGVQQVLELKRDVDPLPPSSVGADAPAELEQLCMRLLAREPAARPGAAEILAVLGAGSGEQPAPDSASAPELLLVARQRELDALRAAYRATAAGRATTVHLSGPSGMGKTALLTRFLDALRAEGQALILAGRCFERESVPYKALDSTIDALTRHLLARPRHELWKLLPPGINDLARLFPVLKRVEAVQATAALTAEVSDPREVRRRAIGALRALLEAMGRRQPVIIAIDDLQWGDTDSAVLLAEVLRPPDPPPVLFVVSYRAEAVDNTPFLRTFLASTPDIEEIRVGALAGPEAQALAEALLSSAGVGGAAEQAAVIARESGGSPLFLHELVEHVVDADRHGARLSLDNVTLEDMLRKRVAALPAEAVRLLEVISIAGRPISQGAARWAAELEHDDRKALAHLRAAKLVRTEGARDQDLVETFHDRIREAIAAAIPEAARRQHHLQLAIALERAGNPDPEEVAVHLDAGGQHERAAQCYWRAAEIAGEALAFDKSATLYRRAVELRPPDGAGAEHQWAQFADALARCGRGPEAAEVYLRAAEQSRAGRLDFQRRAGEQLLFSGHLDAGVEILDRVLGEIGVRAPTTSAAALRSLLWHRAVLRLRGLRFKPRDASQIRPEQLNRIDVFWTAGIGSSMNDNLRGADFQARHLLAVLRAGERGRIARALALEAMFLALESERSARRGAELAERAVALAEEVGDALGIGWSIGARALVAYLRGQYRYSLEQFEITRQWLDRVGLGAGFESTVWELNHLWSLFYLGRVGELAQRIPELLQAARDRGDLYSQVNLTTGLPNIAWLVRDEVDEARRVAASALERWSPHGYHFQHYWQLLALCHIDLYAGRPAEVLARLEAEWPLLNKAFMFRIRVIRVELHSVRARARLLAAAEASADERARLLRGALDDARRMTRGGTVAAGRMADLLRAGVAVGRGEIERGIELLEQTAAGLEEVDMALHAACARRRAGELRGGEEGARLIEAADAWMRTEEVAAPARMAGLIVPLAQSPKG